MTTDYIKNLRRCLADKRPETLLILGSGLGGLADSLQNKTEITYSELGFPASTVKGHAGKLAVGEVAGKTIACMQGRCHLYFL